MTSRIKALCEEARRQLKIAQNEVAGTIQEELIDGSSVVRVIMPMGTHSATAVFKDETRNGQRKLIEIILRVSSNSTIEAVYKIDE